MENCYNTKITPTKTSLPPWATITNNMWWNTIINLIHAKSFPSRGIIPLIEFIGVIKISIYKSNFYLQVNYNQTAMVELSAPSFNFNFQPSLY